MHPQRDLIETAIRHLIEQGAVPLGGHKWAERQKEFQVNRWNKPGIKPRPGGPRPMPKPPSGLPDFPGSIPFPLPSPRPRPTPRPGFPGRPLPERPGTPRKPYRPMPNRDRRPGNYPGSPGYKSPIQKPERAIGLPGYKSPVIPARGIKPLRRPQ